METLEEAKLMLPWAVGQTLRTRTTQVWTDEQWQQNESAEKRLVFAGFRASDQGRSRELIAECKTPEDAAFIVRAANSHHKLLEALEAAQTDKHQVYTYSTGDVHDSDCLLCAKIDAAIKSAVGNRDPVE